MFASVYNTWWNRKLKGLHRLGVDFIIFIIIIIIISIHTISLFSVYFPSYVHNYVLSLNCIWIFPCTFYVFSACFMYVSCMSVYSSHLVCISCRFQTKYSFSPSGRANFRPLTIVWTEIDISSEQHCFEILQRIISTLFLSAEQNCFDKLKNIFSTLLLSC